MPLGQKPICTVCKTANSSLWRKGLQNEILCNSCFLKQQTSQPKEIKSNGNNGKQINKNNNIPGPAVRKSMRLKPSKHRAQIFSKPISTKGKSRRIVFKKSQPLKSPTAVSTVITGDSVFHDDMYFQKGDVVSLVDHDLSVYYAQIRGFLQDQFNEKSAVITWLLPTKGAERENFDPSYYILGPEEELPRKLDYMEFVCHAPSDYFKSPVTPYTTVPMKPELCYVWQAIESPIMPMPTGDELYFGLQDPAIKQEKEKSNKKSKSEKKEKEKHPKKESEKKQDKPEIITEVPSPTIKVETVVIS